MFAQQYGPFSPEYVKNKNSFLFFFLFCFGIEGCEFRLDLVWVCPNTFSVPSVAVVADYSSSFLRWTPLPYTRPHQSFSDSKLPNLILILILSPYLLSPNLPKSKITLLLLVHHTPRSTASTGTTLF